MYQNNSLTGRLNQLLEESGLSQDKFAKKCTLSLAALKNYITSEDPRIPNTESLLKICNACNVSADWLLGLSDVRTVSADMRSICEFSGLTEEAIKKIRCPELNHPYAKTLSHMIESDNFVNLITTYKMFLETLNQLEVGLEAGKYSELSNTEIRDDGSVLLSAHDAVFHFRQKSADAMDQICFIEYLERMNRIAKKD